MRFILIDRIDRLVPGKRAEGYKLISPDEDYFRDHFPGYPLMPGALLIESMAQTSGWLIVAERRFESMPFLASLKDVKLRTFVTPGSQLVRRQAEREGLHDIFQDAGALWTHSSCGPCLGMSMGVLAPGMRCISSSNRNFPGRMGDGGRVHLAAPVVVAASAILGRIASPAELPALELVPA